MTSPKPPLPKTLAETGLSFFQIEELILKSLLVLNEQKGQSIAEKLGLQFSVIEPVLESARHRHLLQGLHSMGVGNVSLVYSLTELGLHAARSCMESNKYVGPAPVSAEQYIRMVNLQRRQKGWLRLSELKDGFSHMVTTPALLSRLGPALNAGQAFLIYGNPGNGKTLIAEAVVNLMGDGIFIPHAIENNGDIIQMYDPVIHKRMEEPQETDSIMMLPEYDQRWMRVQRPFAMSGGELTLDVLDVTYNPKLGYYTAPLQMKANNGVYLIDDLGRQRASVQEVLNRWIVPLEQGVDHITFQNGSTLSIPFDTFLIFSTNLRPGDVADEALLRRIHYKMLVHDPVEEEFVDIFRFVCESEGLEFDETLIRSFVGKRYGSGGKAMRRCHPRDILRHAINLLDFHDLPMRLTLDVLEEAFQSCFLEAEAPQGN